MGKSQKRGIAAYIRLLKLFLFTVAKMSKYKTNSNDWIYWHRLERSCLLVWTQWRRNWFACQTWNFSFNVNTALSDIFNICHILKPLNKEKVNWVSYLQHEVNLLGMAALRWHSGALNTECWRLNANTGTEAGRWWSSAELKKRPYYELYFRWSATLRALKSLCVSMRLSVDLHVCQYQVFLDAPKLKQVWSGTLCKYRWVRLLCCQWPFNTNLVILNRILSF